MTPCFFFLIAKKFSIKCVVNNYLHHLRTVLTNHYTITEDLNGIKFSGIDLNWKYAKYHTQRICCLSMDGYIDNLLLKFGHKAPTKTQLSTHHHRNIVY